MNELDRIYENVKTFSEINCIACRRIGGTHSEGYDAAEEFKEKGWRVTVHGNVYCPNCAKKKLKT